MTVAAERALSLDYLRAILSYDPYTGIFTWRTHRARVRPGTRAGNCNGFGYVIIQIDGQCFRAHRLAWFHVHGTWPADQIDHINRHRADNRLINLREANTSQNMANAGKQKNNTSGYRGVFWRRQEQTWHALIRVRGKLIHLGYFRTRETARAAYVSAAERYFGEFASTC